MATKGKTRNYNSTYNLASTVNFGMQPLVNNSDYGCVVGILWDLRMTVLTTNVEENDRAMAADGTTIALVSSSPR